MKFRELSDDEWELIRPLLPPRAKVGRPRANDRNVINGILYVLTTAVGPGDEHDSKRFIEVLGRIRVKRKIGRPINRPKEL